MIVPQVTQIGTGVIRKKAKPVKNAKAASVKKIVRGLIDSMRHHGLIGMAAPQIGKGLRIFVSEIRRTKTRKRQRRQDLDPLRVYINPVIIFFSTQTVVDYEGCGSVAYAQLFGRVRRPKTVVVEACDAKGVRFQLKAHGLLARVIQHEYDHINGTVFIDKVVDTKTMLSRQRYIRKFHK